MQRADSLEKTLMLGKIEGRTGEGGNRRRDGWMASLTHWTWVWVDSRSWWWTGRPGTASGSLHWLFCWTKKSPTRHLHGSLPPSGIFSKAISMKTTLTTLLNIILLENLSRERKVGGAKEGATRTRGRTRDGILGGRGQRRDPTRGASGGGGCSLSVSPAPLPS